MKSIRKILACIRVADEKYNLINKDDKIVLGLSGGKDSNLLLYALSLYQKFSQKSFTIQPVILDLGFPNFNSENLKNYCKSLGFSLIVEDSKQVYKILNANQKEKDHLPCSICSRMKKAAINKVAKRLGFNKVAFAHHADDAIETFFLNEIYGGRLATFSPKMHLEKTDIIFIRPLILCRESEIKKCVNEEDIPVFNSCCPADKHTQREKIKTILNNLYKEIPEAKSNFLLMLSNYKKDDLWGKEIQYQIYDTSLILKPVIYYFDMIKVFEIREKVFVEEQEDTIEDEFFSTDEKNVNHFLLLKDNVPIGTLRYRELANKTFKIERVALLKEYRHKGYMKLALVKLIDLIKKKNTPCTITLNGQYDLLNYYRSLGFKEEGDIFIEANIKHIKLNLKF